MRRRAISPAATLVLLACLVLAAAGRPSTGEPPASAQARPSAPAVAAAVAAVIPAPTARDRARLAEQRRRHGQAVRRAQLRRLSRSRTVKGTLRRAWLAGTIDAPTHRRLRRIWWTSARAARRLGGHRRAQLQATIDVTALLARTRSLTSTRLEPVFLTLRRNRDFWTRRALPRPGERLHFGRDPVVFQYYPGRGLQIQPLASFGRANALARSCVDRRPRHTCRPAALRRLLNRMVDLGATRGGFLAWEHYFHFGGGRAPWISAMTQGTGAQALARGGHALREPRFAAAARRALGAFETAPPTGIAVGAGTSRRYVMYSFAPSLRILNGELQALIGLRDTATFTGSARPRRLFERGERAARAAVRDFDTGAWSLYSWGGAESTLSYHRLVGEFLTGLCRRTREPTYCATGQRFARYVSQPPRVGLGRLRGVRARRRTAIAFSLSKVSSVQVRIWDRRGLTLRRDLHLGRGSYSIGWTPALSGRQRVRVVAVGPGGTRSVLTRVVRVKAPPVQRRCKLRKSQAKCLSGKGRRRSAAHGRR